MNTDSEFFPESSSNTSSSTLTTTTTTTTITTITTIKTEISNMYDIDDIDDIDDDDDTVSSIDTMVTEDIREITNDELHDMTETVYQMMEDYMKINIMSMSCSKFYHNMIMYITDIVYTDIYQMCGSFDNDEFDEEMYDEIHNFVEQTIEVFLDIYEFQTYIPRRSVMQPDHELCELSRIQSNVLREKINNLKIR